MFKNIIIGLLSGVIILGTASAVGAFTLPNDVWNQNRGRGDAPVRRVNDAPKDVYEMPDRFSNFAMTCDEYGNAIYVTTKSDASRAMFALKDGCE